MFRQQRGEKHELQTMVSYPRGLGHGRTAFHIFSAMLEWFPLVRKLGFNGPPGTVYVLDGMSFECLSRKLKARHELYYVVKYDANDPAMVLLRSKDLPFVLRCISHGANRAINSRWGLRGVSSNEIVDAAHISIASLINASVAFHTKLMAFLFRHVFLLARL